MADRPVPVSHPILSCAAALDWEGRLLKSDEEAWAAMSQVGVLLAKGIRDYYAMSSFPQSGLRVLGLIGKGHNGGDALLALAEMAREPACLGSVGLFLSSDVETLKPHTRRALDLLRERAHVEFLDTESMFGTGKACDICLDGLLGMQFRPPLREELAKVIRVVNESPSIRLRVAVDLPSGVGDESDGSAFRADVTFATGIFKRPLLSCRNAGVLRYLDIGFFEEDCDSKARVVVDRILDPLRGFRAADSEKRCHGHLAILAGSRGMPGALAMCVRAALQSGAGLVTVFAPESVVSQLACALPEAMWRTWPESPEGGLALEGLWQIRAFHNKASALLMGPGMGADAETLALMEEVGRVWEKPVVLDADALRPAVVDAFVNAEERILTPHDGEFKRLTNSDDCSDEAVLGYAGGKGLTLVKKGPATRVSDGYQLFVNTSGNPVLARGGSGDLLAGLMAGLLAEGGTPAVETACRAVHWHGRAADLMAMDQGQTAVRTTELLDYLRAALRT